MQRLLALTIARIRARSLTSIILLAVGFIAVVAGTVLPSVQVFFPTTVDFPVQPGEDEEHTRGSPHDGTAGEDDDKTSREQQQLEPGGQAGAEVETETYYFLPEDFVDRGTLSNVCCSHSSAQGKIWASCLVCYAFATILSHYTFNLYPLWCPGNGADTNDLANSQTGLIEAGSLEEVAARMVWLLVPNILFILVAAIPTVRSGQQQDPSHSHASQGDRDPHQSATSSRSAPITSAQEAFWVRNKWWLKSIHGGLAGISLGVLLFSINCKYVWVWKHPNL